MKPSFFLFLFKKYNIYSRLFCSGENRGYGFVSEFLHLPSRLIEPKKSLFPAYTPKNARTPEQASKSLI